jgi:hypothetical protein
MNLPFPVCGPVGWLGGARGGYARRFRAKAGFPGTGFYKDGPPEGCNKEAVDTDGEHGHRWGAWTQVGSVDRDLNARGNGEEERMRIGEKGKDERKPRHFLVFSFGEDRMS